MKRLAALALLSGVAIFAQQAAKEPEDAKGEHSQVASENEGEHDGLAMWKWANFIVLAAGLGYLIGKNAGPTFAARSTAIRKDMDAAAADRAAAEAKAAEVEKRLAGLESEIAALRAEAQQQAQNERERLARQTADDMARIQHHAEQEIAAAGKAARLELKRYSASLAVSLAEHKLRDRMNAGAQDALVDGFVRHLQ